MISRVSGDICFSDGMLLRPQQPLHELAYPVASESLPIPGWMQHELGVHSCEYGEFEVEVVCGPEHRIYLVLLNHRHSFYEAATAEDCERRVFHHGILAKDLSGQREFSWGQAFCRLDPAKNKNWLVVAYNIGPQVPIRAACELLGLEEVCDGSH